LKGKKETKHIRIFRIHSSNRPLAVEATAIHLGKNEQFVVRSHENPLVFIIGVFAAKSKIDCSFGSSLNTCMQLIRVALKNFCTRPTIKLFLNYLRRNTNRLTARPKTTLHSSKTQISSQFIQRHDSL